MPLGPQVQHITELLAPHAEALPITRPLPAIAAYHDPCHLGRRLGSLPASAGPTRQAPDANGGDGQAATAASARNDLFDGPRRLLERATRGVAEFPYHHEGARCCGAGGLMPVTEPAIAQAMAQDRLAELQPARRLEAPDLPAGLDAPRLVVTSCPGCQHHLAKSGPEPGSPASVRSLIELLEEATRPDGAPGPIGDGDAR